MKYRRLVIDFEIDGSVCQADLVRDAVGRAADNEWLGNIIEPLVESEKIKNVKWTVRGCRWIPTKKPSR